MNFIPINSTVQMSDTSGNIAHQGVLASNINGSDILTSYPSSSTGNSTGHYHFTNPSTLALNILNCSGDNAGGFELSNASNNNAPVTYFEANKDQVTVNTSLTNTNNSLKVDLINNAFQILILFLWCTY